MKNICEYYFEKYGKWSHDFEYTNIGGVACRAYYRNPHGYDTTLGKIQPYEITNYWVRLGSCEYDETLKMYIVSQHNLDGPSVFIYNGRTQWWFNNSNATLEIQKWAKENDIDLDNLTEVDKALIKLTWADYGK